MKKTSTLLFIAWILMLLLAFPFLSTAQNPKTLEVFAGSGNISTKGPTIAPQTLTLLENTDNPTSLSTAPYSKGGGTITVAYSLSNQQYNTASWATNPNPNNPGVFFGGTTAIGNPQYLESAVMYPQGAVGQSSDGSFTSSPLNSGGPGNGISTRSNYGIGILTSAAVLRNARVPVGGRIQMADLTITFSRPVSNPVLHLGGMGGSFLNNTLRTYFSQEYTLLNPGITLSKLSGSPELIVDENSINNGAIRPDGLCGAGGGCGSVLLTGRNIKSFTLRVFFRSTGPGTEWVAPGHSGGDLANIGVSLDSPVDLSITKTANNMAPPIGGNIIFTLRVENLGNNLATGINVKDQLASGYTFLSATSSSGSYNNLTGVWNPGNLAEGENATLNVLARVNTAGVYSNTATIVADQDDPVNTNNVSTITPVPVKLTDLQITKSVDNLAPVAGSNVVFNLNAINNGPSQATGVSVMDLLPAGYTFIANSPPTTGAYNRVTGLWTIGTLASSESAGLTITARVDAVGPYVNSATIKGIENESNTGNNTATVTPVPIPNSDRSVVKTVNDPTPVTGTNVTFTLVANNRGPSAGTGIVVDDLLPAGYTFISAAPPSGTNYDPATGRWTIGNISNGRNATMTITAKVNAVGPYANTATISGTESDPVSGNDQSTVITAPASLVNLSVLKTVNNLTPFVGNDVTFTLVVGNTGPSSATGVVLNDLLPSGYTFVSASPSTGIYNNSTGVWSIENLNNGLNATLMITATVNSTGIYTNTAVVRGNETDSEPDNNSSTVKPNPIHIEITKTGPSTASTGTRISYVLAVTNVGTGGAIGEMISDLVPVELTNVTWNAVALGSASITSGASGAGNNVSVTGDIPAGGASQISVTISGDIPSSSTATTLSNTAQATASGSPVVNSNPVNTTIKRQVDLHIEKSGPSKITAGSNLSYTIRVQNEGPAEANNVVISDPVPIGLNQVTWTATGQNGAVILSAPSGTGAANLLARIPSKSGEVLVTVHGVLDGSYASPTIINTATANPEPGVTDPTPATSSVSSTVKRSANIRITKSGPANIGAGENIAYTLRVVNDGPSDAYGVEIKDVIPNEIINATWTAVAQNGAIISASSGTGNINLMGDIPSGTGVIEIHVNGTVDPATNMSTFSNVASANFPAGSPLTDPDPDSNTNTITTAVNNSASLRVSKSGPSTVNAGDPIDYVIVVTNGGAANITNALIDDVVPNSVTVNSWEVVSSGGALVTAATSGTGNTVSSAGDIPADGNPLTALTINIHGIVNANAQPSFTNIVSVTAGGVTQSAVTTAVTQSTDIVIEKDGLQSLEAGLPIFYTIKVSNAGPNNVSGLVIDDLVPADIHTVSWTATATGSAAVSGPLSGSGNNIQVKGDIAAGESNYLLININGILNSATSLTSIDNTASVTLPGSVIDFNTSNNSSTVTTLITKETDLTIAKTVNNSEPRVGDQVVFTISAVNNGHSGGTGVVVTELLPAGFTYISSTLPSGTAYDPVTGVWNIGVLDVGSEKLMVLTALVNPTGPYVNTAAITGVESDPDTDNNSSTVTLLPTSTTDRSIVKTVDISNPAVGSNVVFTLITTNNGPSNGTDISVADVLPDGYTYLSSNPAIGTVYDPITGIWTIGTLLNGASSTLTITAKVNASGPYLNTATVDGAENDPAPQNNTSTVIPVPSASTDRSVTKTIDNANPAVGDYVVFTLVATNNGLNNGTGITVTDLLPNGYTYVSSTAPAGTTYDPATGVWAIGTLANEESMTMTISALVNATGSYGNTARITGIENDPVTNNDQSMVVPVPSPMADLNTVKTLKDPSQTSFVPGSAVVYRISVTNNGPSDAMAVNILDTAPEGTTITGWTTVPLAGVTYPNASGTGDLNETIATLANGLTAVYEVTVQTPSGFDGSLSNSVIAGSSTEDPTPDEPCTTCVTPPLPQSPFADLHTIKTLKDPSQTSFVPGRAVVYQISVTNNGPSDASEVHILDTAPAGTTITGWISVPSTGVTYPNDSGSGDLDETIETLANGLTAVYAVTVQTPSNFAGSLSNSVTAGSDTPDPTPDCTTCVTPPLPQAPQADLNTVKILENPLQTSFVPGEEVVYWISVTNNGPGDASAVHIRDIAPAGTTISSWVSVPSTGVTYPNDSGTGNLDETIATLPNGLTASYEVTVQTPSDFAGSLSNSVTAGSSTPDPTPDCTTCVTPPLPQSPRADLNTVKTLKDQSQTSFVPGQAVVYIINVTNNGPSDAAAVTIKDIAPAGTTITGWTSISSTGVTYPNASGTGNLNETLAALGNGRTASYEVTVQTPASFTGSLSNTVTATSTTTDPTADPCTTCTTVPISSNSQAALVVVKALKDPAQTSFVIGDAVVYTIKVTNNGPNDALDVNIKDIAPKGTVITRWAAVPATGVTYPNIGGTTDLNETIAALPNALTATYEVTVQTPVNFTSSLINTVAVTSSTSNPNSSTCPNCTTLPLNPVLPDIIIPNVITPDGDGKNDRFVIVGIEQYPGSVLMIYNRWGNQVYSATNYDNSWTGDGLSGGTYYYILQLKTGQNTKGYKGWIELLK